MTVSKRTGTSNRIEIQFRTFNSLSCPDSFVKLLETLCLCLAQGNEYLGQIWDRNLIPLMRYWIILNQKWISILQLVPGLFRVPRSPGLSLSCWPCRGLGTTASNNICFGCKFDPKKLLLEAEHVSSWDYVTSTEYWELSGALRQIRNENTY